jgi:hypothetical protein
VEEQVVDQRRRAAPADEEQGADAGLEGYVGPAEGASGAVLPTGFHDCRRVREGKGGPEPTRRGVNRGDSSRRVKWCHQSGGKENEVSMPVGET